MLSTWEILQIFVELTLLVLHVTVAAFIGSQAIHGSALFKNAFYYIYLMQTVADVGDYLTVGIAGLKTTRKRLGIGNNSRLVVAKKDSVK